MNYSLILLCAGSGKRTGLKYNKIFYKINQQTVYEMNISHFLEDTRCKQIIVVTKENEIEDIKKLVNDPRIEYVFGGQERQDSVYEGLQKVKEDYVFIHDGARPYVSKKSIDDLVACLKDYAAGLLMVPCKDTIKEVKDGIVVKTLKRETLMQAQTPQVFKSEDIKIAYQKAKDEGFVATDDSQLFERYIDTAYKNGISFNIKITDGVNSTVLLDDTVVLEKDSSFASYVKKVQTKKTNNLSVSDSFVITITNISLSDKGNLLRDSIDILGIYWY